MITAITLDNTAALDFGDFTSGTTGGTIVIGTDGNATFVVPEPGVGLLLLGLLALAWRLPRGPS